MSDRMVLQGYDQNENTLKDIVVQLCLDLGPSTTHFNYIFMCSSCMNQIKNTQTFRAPPDYDTNLVPWDQRGRPWFVILLILSIP